MRYVRVTIVAVETQKSIKHSECASVALAIQHAIPMRRIIMPSVVVGVYHILAHSS